MGSTARPGRVPARPWADSAPAPVASAAREQRATIERECMAPYPWSESQRDAFLGGQDFGGQALGLRLPPGLREHVADRRVLVLGRMMEQHEPVRARFG